MPIISGASGGGGGSFTLIGDSLLAAPAASFDTNTILGGNLPTTYKHLRMVLYGRSDRAAAATELAQVRFNGDSTAGHYMYATSTFTSAATTLGGTNSDSAATLTTIPAATATANYFGLCEVALPAYNETTGFKNYAATGGYHDTAAAGHQDGFLVGGFWLSTAAITRIVVICGTGANFIAGSHFTVYGLA